MKNGYFKYFIFTALSAVILLSACKDEEASGGDNYAINSIFACGATGSHTDIPTTKLIITVNDDSLVLTADDIKLNSIFYVIKGGLKKTGAMTYELAILPGGNGAIKVGLDPYRGFTGWDAKTENVHADWYFSGTSELTITGKYALGNSLKVSLEKEGISVPITAIGDRAFYNKRFIRVEIPDSVKFIGESAFAYNQLPEIDIPNSVVSIGNTSFAFNQLSKVTIPESLTAIGSGAFAYNQLSEVNIPKNTTGIRNSAFAYNQLSKIDIPAGVTFIGEDAFAYNQLAEVKIPESVTSIGSGAFSNNLLKEEIKIPENVIFLSGFAYNEIEKVSIPDKVVNIGYAAFAYNKLSGVIIPENVLSIGGHAFSHNELTSVTISGKVTEIGYRAFAYNNLSEVIIPDSVKNIDIHAFLNNPLTSITIGGNVTLGTSAFGNGFENAYNIEHKKEKGTYILNDADGKKTWIIKEE